MEVVTGKPIFETIAPEEEEETVFSYPYAFFREADRAGHDRDHRDGGVAVLERAAGGDGQSRRKRPIRPRRPGIFWGSRNWSATRHCWAAWSCRP